MRSLWVKAFTVESPTVMLARMYEISMLRVPKVCVTVLSRPGMKPRPEKKRKDVLRKSALSAPSTKDSVVAG